ncbi:hypothetical protein BH11ARM1_BH11ARM1_16060 [soil metagenome]
MTLEARITRLERQNRVLLIVCLALPIATLVGWKSQSDTIQAKRIEIVDDHNVPLVILEKSRTGEGGSIILRDKNGEKRSWWEVAPETGALTLNSAKADGTNDTTLGIQVGPGNARMAIISKAGASLAATMEGDNPQLEMSSAKGSSLFSAPWKGK